MSERNLSLVNLFSLSCGLLMALQLSACSSRHVSPSARIYGFRPRSAEFNLGDAARFDFKIGRIASDGQRRLLISSAKYDRAGGKKLGEFFSLSTDGGASFGPEQPLPVASSGPVLFAFYKGGLAAVYVSNQDHANIFYTRSDTDGASWSEPVQINDEQGVVAASGGGYFSFIQPSENEIACLWTDARRGFRLTFFSASHDGGRTWTPNQAVEYDFREGAQSNPQLVAGAGGRLLAFWDDGRDRQTLFDIRCSSSDDGGQHWSASQKINDDQEHVWQTGPRAVARGHQIDVVFNDFREPGEEGGNDWNIYFTASPDNGQTWQQNIRLNDVQAGVDDFPLLAIDERGTLYCVWRSGRESIFGEIYFAYSTDGGQSWSHSIKVNQNPYYLQLSLVDTQGQERVKFSKLPGPLWLRSIHNEDSFRRMLIAQTVYTDIQMPVEAVQPGHFTSRFTRLVRRERFAGVAVLHLNTTVFERSLRPLLASHRLSTFLFDDRGLVFAKSLAGAEEESCLKQVALAAEAKALLAQPALVIAHREVRGSKRHYLFSILPAEAFIFGNTESVAGEKWFLGVLRPKGVMPEQAQTFQVIFFLILIGALGAVIRRLVHKQFSGSSLSA